MSPSESENIVIWAMNINIAPFIYKISIPARFFGEIYRFLVDMGYDAARIYPRYGGSGKGDRA